MSDAVGLSGAKRRIIERLKRVDSATAPELAAEFGLTDTAVRQHLEALEAAELVVRSSAPTGGRGRPPTHWSLTPAAGALFADRHADLSVDLIESVRTTLGEPALAAVIAARVERQALQYAQSVSIEAPVAERVQVLARLRNAEGYLAEVVHGSDGLGLVEHHCPIRGAAEACADLCDAELDLFRKVLGPDVSVQREQHLLRSDQRCAYRISSR
ncbi:MAG: helix-turn-helix transcriptional regulator [Actinomycetota bacterium]